MKHTRRQVIAASIVWCAAWTIAVGAHIQRGAALNLPKLDTIVEKVNSDMAEAVETRSLGRMIPEGVEKPHHLQVAIHVKTRNVAYAVSEGKKKWAMTIGGTRGPWFESVSMPVFRPDGSQLAYAAYDGRKWCVVQGTQRGVAFDQVSGPVYSGDGKHLAYAASDGGRWFVVVDGRVGERHEDVMSLVVFNPDGSRLAYVAVDRNKSWVIAGDEKFGPHDAADGPVFSPDGRKVAYVARDGDNVAVVVNGKPGPKVDGLPYHLAFSIDAKKLAFAVADKAKNRIEVFDVTGETPKADKTYGPLQVHVVRAQPFTDATLTAAGWGPEFSPDGSKLVYGVNGGPSQDIPEPRRTRGPGLLYFVLDTIGESRIDVNGNEAATVRTDGVVTPFEFTEDGKEVRWLVLRDRELFEKRVTLR